MEYKLKNNLMRNKKGFLARTWLISFVTAIAIIGLGYLMVQGLATKYDNVAVIDENFQSTYNKYSDLQGDIDSMFEEASSDEGLSFVGIYEVTFGATFTIIQLIFSSLLLPGQMLKQFALDTGAPSLVANIIFTLPLIIITIMIVLVVISSISKGKL